MAAEPSRPTREYVKVRCRNYRFMRIADAMSCINQRVSLLGVVVEASIPKTTNGTDVFCTLKIIDASQPSIGFYINFFTETMERLPHVDTIGDIILVSNVVVKPRSSDVYALFNKKFSYFALFGGRDTGDGEPVPYQISCRYKPKEEDEEFITGLRKWLSQHKIEGLNEALSLKDIKEDDWFCLRCKILHMCEIKDDEWMLFLWDGTDTPPAAVEAKLEDEMKDPLPLQLESSPLSRDVLCTFPTVGTVLRMIINRDHEKLGIKYLKTNRWVKFFHIKCQVRTALWWAVLMPYSKLCYLPDDDNCVMESQRSYTARFSSKWERMPMTSSTQPSNLTETDHADVPFVTLMDVLTYPEVTYKFKCVVRVVAICPWMAEDFRAPNGVYRIRLTLEDPTARIHAFLYAEDGVTFFGECCSVDMLRKKRNALLGVADEDSAPMATSVSSNPLALLAVANENSAPTATDVSRNPHALLGATNKDSEPTATNVSRNPPWIQCCLKSYYLEASDVWGTRNYRIFATRLVD